MDLEEFAWNPIIDELIWARESLGSVTEIIPVVASASKIGIRFVGPPSLDHFYPQEPGWFAEWWTEAAKILAREGVVQPMRELTVRERNLLRPSEGPARRLYEEELERREQLRITRVILEARELFWLKKYDRVVSLLEDLETDLNAIDTRKLNYARRKILAGRSHKSSSA